MNYIPYNPNPRNLNGTAGDCTIRMLTKALDCSWDQAFCEICVRAFHMGMMPSANAVWASLLLDSGYKEHSVMSRCKDCYTFKDFANEHKTGEYILCSGTHTAYICDCLLYDSWNSENEVVLYYFSKENE